MVSALLEVARQHVGVLGRSSHCSIEREQTNERILTRHERVLIIAMNEYKGREGMVRERGD